MIWNAPSLFTFPPKLSPCLIFSHTCFTSSSLALPCSQSLSTCTSSHACFPLTLGQFVCFATCGSCDLHVHACQCFFGLCFYLFVVFLASVVLGFARSILVASFFAMCLYFVFRGLWFTNVFTAFCSFTCLSPCVLHFSLGPVLTKRLPLISYVDTQDAFREGRYPRKSPPQM